MTVRSSRVRPGLAALALMLAAALLPPARPLAAQVVTPLDPRGWYPETRGSAGTVGIGGANPRQGRAEFDAPGFGTLNVPANGSLALTTSGDMGDWAFYRNGSANAATGFGALSALSALSFDWWRADVGLNASPEAPWQYQTPVLRLVYGELVEGTLTPVGELVWERWYQMDAATFATPLPLETWVREDLRAQRFWRYQYDAGTYYVGTGESCSPQEQYEFASEPVAARGLSSWLDCAFRDPSAVYVTGIAVGVGSRWPGAYQGYVDNVVLGFGGSAPVIAANFETLATVQSVPEPASLPLVGLGTLLLAAARLGRARARARARRDATDRAVTDIVN